MSVAKTARAAAGPSAAATVKQMEQSAATNKDAAESVAKTAPAVMGGSAALQGYEEILQFSKDNIEAFASASSIVTRGMQDLTKSLVDMAQEAVENTVATSKALVGARTLMEVVELSTSLARSNFDKFVAESTRFGHLSTKVAEEAFTPLSKRLDATAQKLGQRAA